MAETSIHPRAVAWIRDGKQDAYSSSSGIVFRGAAGQWHAQPGNHMLDADFRSWKAAARACEEYHGRRSKITP